MTNILLSFPLHTFESSPLEYNLAKISFPPYVQVRSNSSSTGNSNSGSRLSHADRKAIVVTAEQHEVIVGSLLGRSTRPAGTKRNTRLSLAQINSEYIGHIYDILSNLIRQPSLRSTQKGRQEYWQGFPWL
jgi:hypothetical protein